MQRRRSSQTFVSPPPPRIRDWANKKKTLERQVKRETTGADVNELLKSASEDGPLKGIMGYETRALVSTDYTNDERSGIVDARSTMVVDGTCVKVCVCVCLCVSVGWCVIASARIHPLCWLGNGMN